MSVLVISFRRDSTISSRGNVVGNCASEAYSRYFLTNEEAVDHVARLNAENDYDAEDFQHYFIYPSRDCPTGGISMMEADINLREANNIIPDHLVEPLKRKEAAYRQIRKEREAEQRELDAARRQIEQRKHDLAEFESLKQKLGL